MFMDGLNFIERRNFTINGLYGSGNVNHGHSSGNTLNIGDNDSNGNFSAALRVWRDEHQQDRAGTQFSAHRQHVCTTDHNSNALSV